MASTVDSKRVREQCEEGTPEFTQKLDELAKLVKASKYTVFYTGAGVSTSAGVGDYRGPSGAWTQRKIKELELKGNKRTAEEEEELKKFNLEKEREVKKATKKVSMMDALPTPTHMAQSTLIRLGIAHFVVTTNLDGIYRKAGLKAHDQLCCLHGDVYVERCTACKYDFERNFHVRQDIHVHDHKFGKCEKCGSAPPDHYTGTPGHAKMKDSKWGGRMIGTCDENCGTKDTHINFGECLDDIDWNEAGTHCKKADLCIIAGTSMSLRHITHFPFLAKKVVLINLQATPDDTKATLRIWAKCDPVFEGLMQRLKIPIDPIPVWKPRDAVPIDKIPKWVSKNYVNKAIELENFYKQLEQELAEAKSSIDSDGSEKDNNDADNSSISDDEKVELPPPVVLPSKIIIGNLHKTRKNDKNSHKWTVYVQLPENTTTTTTNTNSSNSSNNNNNNDNTKSIIDYVEFKLHKTFTPSVVKVDKAPFELTRNGWGSFTVYATVHWNSSTKRAPTEIEHTLDFSKPNTFKEITL